MKGIGSLLFILAYFAALVLGVGFVATSAYNAAKDAAWDEASFWVLVFIAVAVSLPEARSRKP